MYKVVLAGDAAVGKSSFIMRLCKGKFVNNLNSTLGVDFQTKTIEIDNRVIALQLWDTAGQERQVHHATINLVMINLWVVTISVILCTKEKQSDYTKRRITKITRNNEPIRMPALSDLTSELLVYIHSFQTIVLSFGQKTILTSTTMRSKKEKNQW
jgi:small GTP-binding protein